MPDLYEQITNRLISQLEKGVVPWKSPYLHSSVMPRNYSTQKEYRGINVLLLGSLCFSSPYFLTFLQAKELGGTVRKGEHGHLVVKYGTYSRANPAEEDDANQRSRGYLKGYTVFNSSQIDGIQFPEASSLPDLTTTQKTDFARGIIESMPQRPPIFTGSSLPCYRKHTDSVHMPENRLFHDEEGYYSTLFHELAHATGHESRLSRRSLLENKGIDASGDTSRKIYAEEELVAEIAASFLNAEAGILEEKIANSAAYIQSWVNALRTKDARGWIVRAAAQGQRAADFILGRELSLDQETSESKALKADGFVARFQRSQASQSISR